VHHLNQGVIRKISWSAFRENLRRNASGTESGLSDQLRNRAP
jgi:hypothetical protein